MCLVNQLYCVSFITEPAMLYQLISVSLQTKIDTLFKLKHDDLRKAIGIENLQDIFF